MNGWVVGKCMGGWMVDSLGYLLCNNYNNCLFPGTALSIPFPSLHLSVSQETARHLCAILNRNSFLAPTGLAVQEGERDSKEMTTEMQRAAAAVSRGFQSSESRDPSRDGDSLDYIKAELIPEGQMEAEEEKTAVAEARPGHRSLGSE